MGDRDYERFNEMQAVPTAVKILVAGGTRVGKTALVSAISEIAPLRVEGTVEDPEPSCGGHGGVDTMVAAATDLDFGRITIDEALILYLFDTPEQNRRWCLRDELTVGALGAVVLADPQRLDECLPAIDYFNSRGTPYVVAVNDLSGGRDEQLAAIRRALRVDPQVPVAHCDPSRRESSKNVLITLLEYVKAAVSRQAATATA
ncbi:MAG: ATP-binding protein [Dactylosporangium sp.]|nr:ATP/GTP-binding protein [Dactylosporangium sp.]NNJ60255.1 ATP-binding protein [Dactylosporangium sp.]